MTSLPGVPFGAIWRCVDLHLHTPGVPTFGLPAGMDVCQQRDYQGVQTDRYSLIRHKADGIIPSPGAELSIGDMGKGLHLLLVCDPDTDRHQGKQSQLLFSDREQHVDLKLNVSANPSSRREIMVGLNDT